MNHWLCFQFGRSQYIVAFGFHIVGIVHACGNYQLCCDADFKAISEAASKNELEIWSIHLPFAPFSDLDPVSFDKEKRRFTYDTLTKFLAEGASFGIKRFVAHPSAEPNLDNERSEKLKIASEFFSNLADYAAQYGATVAVEDLPRTCLGRDSDDIKELISADDRLRVCFDTNHLLKEENEWVNSLKVEDGKKLVVIEKVLYGKVFRNHFPVGIRRHRGKG